MGSLALPLLVLLLQSPAPASAKRPEASAAPRLARVLGLLAEGKSESALEEATLALEYAPEDLELLDAASRAALALGRADEALFYAAIAVDLAQETPERKALLEAMTKRMAEVDPLEGKGAALLQDFAGRLVRLGDASAGRGLHANAVELYGRCAGSSRAASAQAALDRLYAQRKVVESLLETGLDVPVRTAKRGSPERAAREDAAHSVWENAWEIKSPNYTVRTDLPRALAEQVSTAMEQMNRFYRTVFHHRERGGGTARCGIRIYRSRAQFDALEESPPASVGGFYVVGENRVATYDPRSEGRPLSELWETLFHEASHQFTHMISADLVPGWLNEGTASYFEGARLLPNGAVEANLIPDSRLHEVRAALEEGKPTLREVVSYFEEGSYPGEYYGVGWALVYFLHNYEDEACERVYRPLYGEFVDAYRTGGKHDPFERFAATFVKKAKQPGVSTFEDFERRFRTWILELHDLHFGPPEKADSLLARARRQREKGKREAAVESYRWALRKRPDDPTALAGLAEVESELKRRDAAFLHFRQAIAAASAAPKPPPEQAALAEECMRRIESMDKTLSEGLAAAQAGLVEGAGAAASQYVEAGFPRQGLRILDGAMRVLGGDGALRAQRARIVQETRVDTRRWRRVGLAPDLSEWEGDEEWRLEGETLRARTEGLSFLFLREEPPDSFRFEASIEPLEVSEESYLALAFGVNAQTRMTVYGAGKDGAIDVARFGREWEVLKVFQPASLKKGATIRLGVDLSAEGAEFFRDGKLLGRLPLPAAERRGQIGLFLQEAAAAIRDVRVKS